MKKAHAQLCWDIARELANEVGKPVTNRFYRSIKRLFLTVPPKERHRFNANNIRVALKQE